MDDQTPQPDDTTPTELAIAQQRVELEIEKVRRRTEVTVAKTPMEREEAEARLTEIEARIEIFNKEHPPPGD
jgi:uncharacterized protein involved in exopolysaccharide biosynthesis